MKCIEIFNQIYKKEPADVSLCPYRICPLGAHVDHQLGRITGLAIDKGIHMLMDQRKMVLSRCLLFSLKSEHSGM